MGMNGLRFKQFYLNSTKVGKAHDVEVFFSAWHDAYGYYFNDSTPWNADPKHTISKTCTKVKTRMLSYGETDATAARVINSFKKWYKDMYN